MTDEEKRDRQRAASRKWYLKNREANLARMSENQKKQKNVPKHRATRLCNGCRHRAIKKGIEFSLDVEDIAKRIEAGFCEVTGLPFADTQDGLRGMWTASLDRKDPNVGYTPDNVRVVIWMYNAAKGTGTDEAVMKMAEALCQRT